MERHPLSSSLKPWLAHRQAKMWVRPKSIPVRNMMVNKNSMRARLQSPQTQRMGHQLAATVAGVSGRRHHTDRTKEMARGVEWTGLHHLFKMRVAPPAQESKAPVSLNGTNEMMKPV